MDRFIEHKADMRGEDHTKPAYHIKQEWHTSQNMGAVDIEEVKGIYRFTRERFWINCLASMEIAT